MTTVAERAESATAKTGYLTAAAMVRDWADQAPDRIALREKDFGIWQETTWAQYWDIILDAAHGLLALGVEVGDRVSIHSEDRPEWVILDIATIAVRGITVGLYPTNPAPEVQYMLQDSGSEVHLAEDQEQADKVMAVIESLPNLRKIIHVEPRGFRKWKDDGRFLFWDDFIDMGRQHREQNLGAVEERMADATAEDLITLVYTSGTTGPPKGVMINNTNFSYAVKQKQTSAVARDTRCLPCASSVLSTRQVPMILAVNRSLVPLVCP